MVDVRMGARPEMLCEQRSTPSSKQCVSVGEGIVASLARKSCSLSHAMWLSRCLRQREGGKEKGGIERLRGIEEGRDGG